MKFYAHKEINKSKWDSLVNESRTSSLYLNSWYLDAVCPKWDALIWDDYKAAIPLPTKHYLIFKKIYQPYFLQQTGLVVKHESDIFQYLLDFEKWKSICYFSIQIQFNSNIIFPTRFNWNLKMKKNFVLSLSQDYSALWKGYNENRRRNIKKAIAHGIGIQSSSNIDAAIRMYVDNQAKKQGDLKNEVYEVLKRVYSATSNRNVSKLLTCVNTENQIISFALFVIWQNRIYYLFGTMNEEGRKYSAISLLFDHIIKNHASESKILDFEGGNMEGIGNYFASFGAQTEKFACLTK